MSTGRSRRCRRRPSCCGSPASSTCAARRRSSALSVHAARSLAASTHNPGLAAIAEQLARPLPGPLGEQLRDRLRGQRPPEDELPELPNRAAPRTPFNKAIGAHRRFAYTTIPLAHARDIRRAFDVTFNDVVMAVCAGTLRRYLQLHDALPEQPLDGDGADQRAVGRRGRHLREPGVRPRLRAGHRRARSA